MGNMRFKVGDRVRIKSLDWYNKNKDNLSFYTDSMALCFANEIVTIKSYGRYPNTYRIDEDEGDFLWTDEMIEGLVEEESKPKFKVGDKVITNKGYIGKFKGWVSDYQVRVLFEESGCNVVIHPKDLKLMEEETKSSTIEEAKTYWDSIKDAWICPDGYQFKDENGNIINATKIVLEKKKKEYPKTYEECCKVMGIDSTINHTIGTHFRYRDTIEHFIKLLICRDAYWKIAGEEMGLGKPWEPTDGPYVYCIYTYKGEIFCDTPSIDCVLSFPTEEMRDAFYENFKELIEQCKELL